MPRGRDMEHARARVLPVIDTIAAAKRLATGFRGI